MALQGEAPGKSRKTVDEARKESWAIPQKAPTRTWAKESTQHFTEQAVHISKRAQKGVT